MNSIRLELFITPPSDRERREFLILEELRRLRAGFSQNRIYPSLAELIELRTTLKTIARRADEIRLLLPKRIRGIDLKQKTIDYEELHLEGDDLRSVVEMIAWTVPHLESLIDEGRTIVDFVADHIRVEEVGILPAYLEEGYLMVPELRTSDLHVLRYEISIFTGSGERYRNLKTVEVRTIPFTAVTATPAHIKSELIAAHRELPNPATYFFDTELDFPYVETILPIAKRKLLRQIYT